jgi:hypothetical protein
MPRITLRPLPYGLWFGIAPFLTGEEFLGEAIEAAVKSGIREAREWQIGTPRRRVSRGIAGWTGSGQNAERM